MRNLKIRVTNEQESKEVQELFFELGFEWKYKNIGRKYHKDDSVGFLYADDGCITTGEKTTGENYFENHTESHKEITLPELRDLVVLKRNDKNDRNVIDSDLPTQAWKESDLNNDPEVLARLQPIEKEMKEHLEPLPNGEYKYHSNASMVGSEWIKIPEGAEIAIQLRDYIDEHGVVFYKNGGKSCMGKSDNNWQHDSEWTMDQLLNENYHENGIDLSHNILWQRPKQPEALPFIDDNPQSLNEQYAEIEQVRQALKDNVNHPSHYTQGKVECLDALESATVGKSGIEAVCVANIIKYLWRYEEKNGLEDIKKAQFYLNRLIATLENNNG